MADVLIIGANPTGLILASLLLQHDISVKIIDKRNSIESIEPSLPDYSSLPVVLSCSSLELLSSSRFLPTDLERQSHKCFGARYHWKKRTVLFRFGRNTNSRFPYSLISSYGELSQHLANFFEQLGGAIDWATRPVTLMDQGIFIESTHAAQNFEGRELYNPKWIIVCEGDHDDEIRELFKNNLKIKKYVKESSFTSCDEGELFEKDHLHLLPGIKNLVNFVFYNPQKGTKQLYVADASAPISSKTRHKLLYNYGLSLADNYESIKTTCYQYPSHHNHVLFVGSAANNQSLSYLTGVNNNIHAAFNLAWKLIPVVKKAASKYLILAKENVHREILPHFKERGERLPQRSFLAGLYRPGFIYYYLKRFRQLEAAEGELFYPPHRALKYEHSEIIRMSSQDKEILGPRPGSRAIDVQLEDGSFLLDHLESAKHLILFFRERADLQQALLEEYGDWVNVAVVEDPVASKLYHANPDALFIIRPDRYIGYRTHNFKLHELISYLLRIFATEQLSKQASD